MEKFHKRYLSLVICAIDLEQLKIAPQICTEMTFFSHKLCPEDISGKFYHQN
jgi:hypothetical protein